MKYIVKCNGLYIKYTSGCSYRTTFTPNKSEAKMFSRKPDAERRISQCINLNATTPNEAYKGYNFFEKFFKDNELNINNCFIEIIK